MKHSLRPVRIIALLGFGLGAAVALSACGGGTASPTATPTAAAPTPTPVATSPPASGTITFGTAISGRTISVPANSFNKPHQIVWLARLHPAAASGSLVLTITKTAGAAPIPHLALTRAVHAKAGTASEIVTLPKRQIKAHNILNGTFLVKYAQNGNTLASGTFKITTGPGGAGSGY